MLLQTGTRCMVLMDQGLQSDKADPHPWKQIGS